MTAQGGSRAADPTDERFETVRAAFLRGAKTYGDLGSSLYAALLTAGADEADLVTLACNAQAGSQPAFHLLAVVHFLLLRNPDDPLARFYATLTDDPASPDDAFPELVRYCREHRDRILDLLVTRTVQTTYVERCGILLPLISAVAGQAGEPLNLIEVGCSAGVLLTFDKYAYDLSDGGHIGSPDALLTISCDMHGGPPVRIPRIARRIGLDLHPIDVRSLEQRQWITALSIPELCIQRERLNTALDVVAETQIELHEGDALALIPDILADIPSPVCVYHSACLSYWPEAARQAFDARLKEASRDRDIYRAGIEAPASYYEWHQGLQAGQKQPQATAGGTSELTIARYRDGAVEGSVVAHGPFFGPFEWIGAPAWA